MKKTSDLDLAEQLLSGLPRVGLSHLCGKLERALICMDRNEAVQARRLLTGLFRQLDEINAGVEGELSSLIGQTYLADGDTVGALPHLEAALEYAMRDGDLDLQLEVRRMTVKTMSLREFWGCRFRLAKLVVDKFVVDNGPAMSLGLAQVAGARQWRIGGN